MKLDDRTELLKDFESRRPRLQAILHLTGGNPRLILSLYRIFAEAEIVEVERSFLALLDDLTPYFQDRMNELAPQQRKIVDAISLMDGPSTPTELAGAARLNVNAVTTQLRRLEKEGYVKSHKERGKKATLYDISERLFRLWRQVSVEAGRRRLRVIVKFLESWFTPQELLRYSALTLSAMEHALSAEKYEMVKALTEKLYYYQEAMPLPEIRASLHFTRIYGLEKSGDKASSDQEVQQLFAEANSKGDQALLARAWWGKAFVHHEREDIHGEIDALSQYLTFNPDDAKAHYNYALLLVDQDRVKEAEEHLQQALRINPHLSAVWGALGSLYMQMGKFALALKKIERVYQLAQEQENKELVEAAAILAFFTRLMLSFKNAQRHNLKQAANHLTKGLAYLPDMPSDSAQKPLGQYLNAVLQFRQPALLEQALDQIEAAGSADLSEFVKPYRAALRYHQTKDKAILNRLFPEIREIVEEMVRQLEAS
ncbi:MAG TPA: tetratricopeptide repeat protein [Candidatus Fraserbacteria bacterium]|nr:tetratricopeptide repeat protein [Candidatus Fraserbacteria bacterium]